MSRFQPGVALLLSLLWEVRWAGRAGVGSGALPACRAAGSPGFTPQGSGASCLRPGLGAARPAKGKPAARTQPRGCVQNAVLECSFWVNVLARTGSAPRAAGRCAVRSAWGRRGRAGPNPALLPSEAAATAASSHLPCFLFNGLSREQKEKMTCGVLEPSNTGPVDRGTSC